MRVCSRRFFWPAVLMLLSAVLVVLPARAATITIANTVTATGNSIVDAQAVTATDSATGHVAVASIACSKLVASPDYPEFVTSAQTIQAQLRDVGLSL